MKLQNHECFFKFVERLPSPRPGCIDLTNYADFSTRLDFSRLIPTLVHS